MVLRSRTLASEAGASSRGRVPLAGVALSRVSTEELSGVAKETPGSWGAGGRGQEGLRTRTGSQRAWGPLRSPPSLPREPASGGGVGGGSARSLLAPVPPPVPVLALLAPWARSPGRRWPSWRAKEELMQEMDARPSRGRASGHDHSISQQHRLKQFRM